MSDLRTVVENGVARVTLDRPPLNILTRDLLGRLRAELATLGTDPTLRVLILDAAGRHFSAGADVGEHLPPEYEDMIPEFLDTVRAVSDFPLPVLAAVQGRCLGGGFELVQAADIIIAADDAVFGQPEIALGVLPPAACVFLGERCGRSAAAEWIYTGDPVDARGARDAGLVRHVVPRAELAHRTEDLARRIARHSAATLRVVRQCLDRGGVRRSAALDEVRHLYVHRLMETSDAVEGLQAFVDRRDPSWRHA